MCDLLRVQLTYSIDAYVYVYFQYDMCNNLLLLLLTGGF